MAISEIYKEAELGVLGALITAPQKTAVDIFAVVTADDFINNDCKTVFKAAYALYAEAKGIDSISILAKVGSAYKSFIEQLIYLTVTIHNYKSCIDVLLECSKRYKAGEISQQINELALMEGDLEEIKANAEELVTVVSGVRAENTFSMTDLELDFFSRLGQKRTYLDWGFDKLNEYIYAGYGDYIVIGARPSVGKTAFSLQLAMNFAKKHNVSFFSFETDKSKIIDRIMSAASGVDFGKIKRGETNEHENEQLAYSKSKLSKLDFHFVHSPGYTVENICAEALRNKSKIIFIDYIGLVAYKDKKASEYDRITAVSIALHTLAQKHNITVINLCQLNRSGYEEPTMENLRSSGQIEQDADVIMLLGMNELKGYETDEELREWKKRRIINIAKNKEGKCGGIPFWFIGENQRFVQEWNNFYKAPISSSSVKNEKKEDCQLKIGG